MNREPGMAWKIWWGLEFICRVIAWVGMLIASPGILLGAVAAEVGERCRRQKDESVAYTAQS